MTRTLVLSVPAPHEKQALIDACDKKRVLVNAGRRGGKTVWASRKAIKEANAGRQVLYIAPVSAQTDAFWMNCKDWLADALLVGLVKKNETKRTMEFWSGGRIEARTGNKPDHLRGGYGDYIVLDEYAYQAPEIWEKVCSPMLLDNNGSVVFISTPNLRNHFYHLYLKAEESEDWAVFQFSSHDNPHLSVEALEDITEDMTDVDYRQEILAEFVPGVGAVFTVHPEDFYNPAENEPGLHKGHRLVAGLDWGQKEDYTALSVGCATCSKEIALHRMKEVDYPTQREFIKQILSEYENVELLAEANAMGQPNIEQLWQDGIDVMPFTTTNSSKAGIVQSLRLSFSQSAWKWVDDKKGWLELEAFEMKISPSGLQKFSAPEGLHDDTVIARCLMLHQAISGRFTLG